MEVKDGNSNSDKYNINSIINNSSVEVLSGVVFLSAAERPFRARSAAERRGAARSALGIHFPLISMQFGP